MSSEETAALEALAAVKSEIFNVYQAHLGAMRDMIEDKDQATSLHNCGYRNLEAFLVGTVKYITKEVEKRYARYEKEFP